MNVINIEPQHYASGIRERLAEHCRVDYREVADKPALIELLQKKPYEALFVALGIAIDADVLAAAPRLRFIVSPTTGLNHIDLTATDRAGITVVSLKGEAQFLSRIQSTSELTWGLLLAVIRRITAAAADVHAGGWHREQFMGYELNGKTLGILGYGRLGRIVARYGLAFGMQVLVNDTDPAQVADLPPGMRSVTLEELLQETDVLSLHMSYRPENHHFIGEDELAKTKPGLILINTARGELLDEGALLRYLESDHIRAAGIDVLEGDSEWAAVPQRHQLVEFARHTDRLLITPHIGGYAYESIVGTRAFIVEKFLRAVEAAATKS